MLTNLELVNYIKNLKSDENLFRSLTKDTNQKIIGITVVTNFNTFENFSHTLETITLSDYTIYFKNKYILELNLFNENECILNITDISEKVSFSTLITILSPNLWLFLAFDKKLFREIIVKKLIKYIPGFHFGKASPKVLRGFIEKHVSEDSISIKSNYSPFVIAKRTKLPSKIEEKYKDDKRFKEYYQEREIEIAIKANKDYLKNKLVEAKNFVDSELVAIDFKIISPNPGGEVEVSADALGVVEDNSYYEKHVSPTVIAPPLESIISEINKNLSFFEQFIPKKHYKFGIKFIEDPKIILQYKISFFNSTDLENREVDSYFLEKLFLDGALDGWDYFSGRTINRSNLDFVLEIFERKFDGSFLIQVEFNSEFIVLYIKPRYWTTSQSFLLLEDVLLRKLDWHIERTFVDAFPSNLIKGDEDFGYIYTF